MESAYNKERSEDVAPGTRSAINKAWTLLGAQAFVVDLDDDPWVGGDEVGGSDKKAAVRARFRRFCTFKGYPTPPIAPPIRDNFLGISGRRVLRLELSDTQKSVLLSGGTDFRAALEEYAIADPEEFVQARDWDEAVDTQE